MKQLRGFWRGLQPAVRLAAAYVAIIMAITVAFSASLYRLSSQELENSLRHEFLRFQPFISQNVPPSRPDLTEYQDELTSGRRHLALELTYFNFIILILAGAASYQLAKRTMRPIEDALEAQTRFSADASHELRTPLAAMQSEIEVALRNPKLTTTHAKRLLESNLEEVGKLKALSDGLLRLARGTAQLEAEAVDLEEAVKQAAQRLSKAAAAKDIRISHHGGTVTAAGDAQTLVELVAILLDNAIKYSPAGSRVTVGLARQSRQAVLTVQDEGPGIAAADLPHIFERFYRGDTSRTKGETGGYGLGLSIARKIVDAHHGSLEADSRPGQGARFTVRLPLAG